MLRRKQMLFCWMILRRFPSILANRLIAFVTGVKIHDTGCTLKAFRRELIENLPIYAEQHRFLPVLSLASGARITPARRRRSSPQSGHCSSSLESVSSWA